MVEKAWKSLGSGDVDHVPPKSLGYVVCNQSVAQPPEECPCRNLPEARASMRYRDSRWRISSVVSARPQGPLFTESANSWVPVGLLSSRKTQIISGIFLLSMWS